MENTETNAQPGAQSGETASSAPIPTPTSDETPAAAAPATPTESTTSSAPSRSSLPKTVEGRPLQVMVDDRGLERAIRQLKRKCANEGILRELKRRRHYEKPSVRRRNKARDAERRRRRAARRLAKKGTERR